MPFLASPAAPTSGPAVLQQMPGTEMNPGSQPSHSMQAPPQSVMAPGAVSQQQYASHVDGTSAGNQPVNYSGAQSGPTKGNGPVSSCTGPNVGQPQVSSAYGQNVMAPSSGPAMLPVTQLPSGGVSQGRSSQVVDDDDDFADFQAATPSTTNTSNLSASSLTSPKPTTQR